MVVCSLVVEVGTLAEDVGGVVVEAKVVIVSVAVVSDRDVVTSLMATTHAELVLLFVIVVLSTVE